MKSTVFLYASIISCLLFTISALGISCLTIRSNNEPISLKENTISKIKKDTSNISNFLGIMIVSANIQANSRSIVYIHLDNRELNKMFEDYIKYKRITQQESLFVTNGDLINQRTIDLINNQFICVPWNEVSLSRPIPDASRLIKSVCSVAIPPSYGAFNGTLSIFLSQVPSDDDKIYLMSLLREISNSVGPELIRKN